MARFRALVARRSAAGLAVAFEDFSDADLMDGDVEIDVRHSTLNYKDGLALTGRMPIIRKFPLIPGIDLAGIVRASTHAGLRSGDAVVANGWGLGETHHGGYAGRARVKGDWLVVLPTVFDTSKAMAIGTAGYTAMLAVMALERNGLTPGAGPILVTGAAGGVGSIAIALLAGLGYEVVASTGRLEEKDFLIALGARSVMSRAELSGPARPLGTERWAGAIDVAGSHTLANVLAMTRYGGTVAACGLAHGMELATSVAPFILRGVTLAGIDSVMAPLALRREAWSRLARDLDVAKLALLTSTRRLEDVLALAPDILAGHVRGRVVLEVGS